MTRFFMHRDALVKWGTRICTMIILGVLLIGLYWAVIDRAVPMENLHGRVVNYERQQDGSWVLFVRWRGTRHRVCQGNSQRWLAQNALLPLPDIPYPPSYDRVQIGEVEWEVPVHVPAYFVSTGHVTGAYVIRIEYACNPLQQHIFPIVVEPEPVPFEIPSTP